MKNSIFLICIFFSSFFYSQKDSLNLGDYYADDQLYLNIYYSQLIDQPKGIDNNNFSYSLSGGFIKDIILNNSGTFSVASGVGIGRDFFNHTLKIEEIKDVSIFLNATSSTGHKMNIVNLELPIQIRWRTSSANKYKFWRIYGGVTILYNLNNTISFTENNETIEYKNISSFKKWQYGATLTAGYDRFNLNVFYGLTPMFGNATLNGNSINTKVLKLGLVLFFL